MENTQIKTDIDYEKPGKQQGYLRVPYSHNNSGWGNLLIPITTIKNGEGPTLLALGGTHGDEYEGPVSLMKLARYLEPEVLNGRVIIIPALNLPAVRAGTRLSPIDGINLNRAFPGRYDDSVTGLIAHYLTNVLFPLSDIVMDIHSGGRSMVFLPCAHLHRVEDDIQFQRMLESARVWGTKYVYIYIDIAGKGLLPVQAEEMGKIVITAEMGGAGECNPKVLKTTERGIRNILIYHGLIKGEYDPPYQKIPVVAATQVEDYNLSPEDGIYESFFEVGDKITKGEPVGQIHFPERCDRSPELVFAQSSGILMCRRIPGMVSCGDSVAVVARPLDV